jgi:RPA family protein
MAAPVGKREVAWRVFAREFNSATTVQPGEDQYAPTYVISPLGALINRVYLTGVLTECENAGTETEPLWRGRVSDPTDVFYISAGQFQPKAARQLAELEVPSLIGIIGKARTYSPDENTLYVSVRVENVKEITQELRDYWVLEACQSLQYRLNAINEASKMEPPNVQELTSLGFSKKISMGIVEAINQFGDIDYQPYHDLLSTVLNELTMETSMDVTVTHSQSAKPELIENIDNILLDSSVENQNMKSTDKKTVSESESQLIETKNVESEPDQTNEKSEEVDIEVSENLIFEIINSLAEDNPDGVSYDAVQGQATEHGLDKDIIEECIGSLIDKGVIYEPTIGVFKAV